MEKPLDLRYKGGNWSLEDMQAEEQRILTEIAKYPLKVMHSYNEISTFFNTSLCLMFNLDFAPQDLPFPDPVESAMVIGHMCGHVTGLPCHEPTVLHELGLAVVRWAAKHAQWSYEQKCLERLEEILKLRVNLN